ncbi:hypothetical protein [Streptomyces sp. M2CJ-2]|uniref:hypothetical protein n=1 Tax=Streptomyces sp. M2CJ-2 TaxID=2803948 RepID=UPI0034D6852C
MRQGALGIAASGRVALHQELPRKRSQSGAPVPLQIAGVGYAAKTSNPASLTTHTHKGVPPGGGSSRWPGRRGCRMQEGVWHEAPRRAPTGDHRRQPGCRSCPPRPT